MESVADDLRPSPADEITSSESEDESDVDDDIAAFKRGLKSLSHKLKSVVRRIAIESIPFA